MKGNHFIIPAHGNTITKKDIEKNMLRITKDYKKYFPEKSCYIKTKIGGNLSKSRFGYRERRSYVLSLGKEAMNVLNIREGDSVRIVLEEGVYELEKI